MICFLSLTFNIHKQQIKYFLIFKKRDFHLTKVAIRKVCRKPQKLRNADTTVHKQMYTKPKREP